MQMTEPPFSLKTAQPGSEISIGQWESLETRGSPEGEIFGHSATVVGRTVWVLGGIRPATTTTTKTTTITTTTTTSTTTTTTTRTRRTRPTTAGISVLSLDLDTLTWQDRTSRSWGGGSQSAAAPGRRWGHSACWIPSERPRRVRDNNDTNNNSDSNSNNNNNNSTNNNSNNSNSNNSNNNNNNNSARSRDAAATDTTGGRILLCGGFDTQCNLHDVWLFDPSNNDNNNNNNNKNETSSGFCKRDAGAENGQPPR
ncbi:unnamed protein product, partial [Polarella glacialis]